MEEVIKNIFANISSKNYKELKEKYKSVDIDDLIEKKVKYYRIKPFNSRTKLVWIDQIKDYIEFINENFIAENKEKVKEESEEVKNEDEISKEEYTKNMKDAYEGIMYFLKKYMDMTEANYRIVSVWILGTWLHNQFPCYPYLFINAMRGSGKTRLLKLIKTFSKEGDLLNSLTEAVMFRTTGTLCIDEFEGINRKGNEQLRELLNSAYKSGSKVKRMTKNKVLGQEKQIVEEFDIYRPIALANIWGMEDVLGDRCLPIILDKSENPKKTMLMEVWDDVLYEPRKTTTLNSLSKCSRCRCRYILEHNNVYFSWNDFICNNNIYTTTLTTTTTTTTSTTQEINSLFEEIKNSGINGRFLELTMPFFIISNYISKDLLNNIFEDLKEIIKNKKDENLTENSDISLIDFLSQEIDNPYFISIKELTSNFRGFVQTNEEWLNERWISRALKRLNLIIERRRNGNGIQVKINYKKAQEKIKIFQ